MLTIALASIYVGGMINLILSSFRNSLTSQREMVNYIVIMQSGKHGYSSLQHKITVAACSKDDL